MLNWKHCFQNRRLNLTFSLKNVHYLGTTNTLLLAHTATAQQLFPPSITTIYNFHFVVLFQSFPIFTDVDDSDMMH